MYNTYSTIDKGRTNCAVIPIIIIIIIIIEQMSKLTYLPSKSDFLVQKVGTGYKFCLDKDIKTQVNNYVENMVLVHAHIHGMHDTWGFKGSNLNRNVFKQYYFLTCCY